MQFASEIINQDNYNIFDNLIGANLNRHINNLTQVYSSEVDGLTREAIQQRLTNKSNLIFLVKTVENKVFGAYVSKPLYYDNTVKMDNQLSLFSVDLNEWFRAAEARVGQFRLNLSDFGNCGLHITFSTLVLLGQNNRCYYNSLDTDNLFNMNGISPVEVFGGSISQDDEDCNELHVINIEVYQLN